jgi:hypothetical protein
MITAIETYLAVRRAANHGCCAYQAFAFCSGQRAVCSHATLLHKPATISIGAMKTHLTVFTACPPAFICLGFKVPSMVQPALRAPDAIAFVAR